MKSLLDLINAVKALKEEVEQQVSVFAIRNHGAYLFRFHDLLILSFTCTKVKWYCGRFKGASLFDVKSRNKALVTVSERRDEKFKRRS